jgi:hypothetical protein
MPYDLIFLIFSAFFTLSGVAGFAYHLYNRYQWEKVKREHYRTRFYFDQLGNPENYFNPDTGEHYLPHSGNKAFADNLIIQAGQSLKTPKRNEPEIFVQGLPLNRDALPAESASAQLPAQTSEDELLRSLKSEGIGKSEALSVYFGVTGGSKFQRLSRSWDSIIVNKE